MRLTRSNSGFSLVEILVVIVIMGLLIGIVAPNVIDRLGDAKIARVSADIHTIKGALKLYKLDNGRYPTTEQGLQALVEPSSLDPEPRNFKQGGYLESLPVDPWDRQYLYLYPGEHGEYDIYTLGADGLSGGEGEDSDLGSWKVTDQ